MGFADRLKFLRKRAQLTQEQLAHRCGWSGQSRVGNYENPGESGREPALEEIPILARALGVSSGTLIDEAEYKRFRNGLAANPSPAGENLLTFAKRTKTQPHNANRPDFIDVDLLRAILEGAMKLRRRSSKQKAIMVAKVYAAVMSGHETRTSDNIDRLLRSA